MSKVRTLTFALLLVNALPLLAQKNYQLPDWAILKNPSEISTKAKSPSEINMQIEDAYHIFSNSTQITRLPSSLTPLLKDASQEQKKQIHYLLGQIYIVLGNPREANLHLTLAQKNAPNQKLPYQIKQWNQFLLPEISHKFKVGTQSQQRVINFQSTPSGKLFFTTSSQDFFRWNPSLKKPKLIQNLPFHELLQVKDSEFPFFINSQQNSLEMYNIRDQKSFWSFFIEDTLIDIKYIHPSLQVIQTNKSFIALQDGKQDWKKTYSGSCNIEPSHIKNNSLILCTHKSFFINHITGVSREFNISNKEFKTLVFNQFLTLYNNQKIKLYKEEQLVWELPLLGVKKVEIHQGFLYVLNSGELVKINPKNGKVIYRKELNSKEIFSTSKTLFTLGSHNQLGIIDDSSNLAKTSITPSWVFFNNNSKYSFYSFGPTQLLHFNRSENSFQIIDLEQSFSIPAYHRNWKNIGFWKDLEPFHPKLSPKKSSLANQWINATQASHPKSSLSFIKKSLGAHKVVSLPQSLSHSKISYNNNFLGYIDPISQAIHFIDNNADSTSINSIANTITGPWKDITSIGQKSFSGLKLDASAYKLSPSDPTRFSEAFDFEIEKLFSSSQNQAFYQKNNMIILENKDSVTDTYNQQIVSHTTTNDILSFINNNQETFQINLTEPQRLLNKVNTLKNTSLLCSKKQTLWSASKKALEFTFANKTQSIFFNHFILAFSCSENQAWLSLGNGDIYEVSIQNNLLQTKLLAQFPTPVFTPPINSDQKLWVAHQNSIYSIQDNQKMQLFRKLPSTISKLFTTPQQLKVLTLDGFYIIWNFPLN